VTISGENSASSNNVDVNVNVNSSGAAQRMTTLSEWIGYEYSIQHSLLVSGFKQKRRRFLRVDTEFRIQSLPLESRLIDFSVDNCLKTLKIRALMNFL